MKLKKSKKSTDAAVARVLAKYSAGKKITDRDYAIINPEGAAYRRELKALLAEMRRWQIKAGLPAGSHKKIPLPLGK